MRLNRLLGVASNPEPAEGHRARAGVVRVLSVAAVAAARAGALPCPFVARGKNAYATTVTRPRASIHGHQRRRGVRGDAGGVPARGGADSRVA